MAKRTRLDSLKTTTSISNSDIRQGQSDFINLLKGTAILGVVCFHFFPSTFRSGYLGLDLFFVITGFLIQKKISSMPESRFFSRLIQNRLRRLVPPLAFMLLICIVFSYFVLSPKRFKMIAQESLVALIFQSDQYYLKSFEYFALESRDLPFLHTWSLGTELKFLLLWPAIYFVARKLGMRTVYVAVFLFVISVALNIQFHFTFGSYFRFSLRIFEFIFGILSYEFSVRIQSHKHHKHSSQKMMLSYSSWVGVTLFILYSEVTNLTIVYLGPILFKMVFCSLTALSLALGINLKFNPIFRFLSFLGKVSYSLYLYHLPILVFGRILIPDISSLELIGLIIFSLLAAILSNYFAERPFLESTLKYSDLIAVSIVCVSIAISSVIIKTEGLPQRVKDERVDFGATYDTMEKYQYRQCWLETESTFNETLCETSSSASNQILLLGDSFAGSLAIGLYQESIEQFGFNSYQRSGCMPLLDSPNDLCNSTNNFVMEKIRLERPSLVIILAKWPLYFPQDSFSINEFTNRVAEIQEFSNVIVVGSPPVWNANLPDLLFNQDSIRPSLKSNETLLSSFRTDEILGKALKLKGILFYSIMNLQCNGTTCNPFLDEKSWQLISYDFGHLSPPFAKLIAEKLVEQAVEAKFLVPK